jgi:hypothetical protein
MRSTCVMALRGTLASVAQRIEALNLEIVGALAPTDPWPRGYVQAKFVIDGDGWRVLLGEEEAAIGRRPHYVIEDEYSFTDLQSAALLNLRCDVSPSEGGGYGPPMEYDFRPACLNCWSGAELLSSLWVDGAALPKSGLVAQTMHGDILIAASIAEKLVAAVPAVKQDLRIVTDQRSQARLPWQLIDPRTTLVRMDAATEGIVRQDPCEVCNRDGHFCTGSVPFRPVFPRLDVLSGGRNGKAAEGCTGVTGFARTWEAFGIGRRPARENRAGEYSRNEVARPMVFATRSVHNTLVESGLRCVTWIPARVLGS